MLASFRDNSAVSILEDGSAPFVPSLFVATAAVSVNRPGMATFDAGYKHLAFKNGSPRIARGLSTPANSSSGAMNMDASSSIPPESAAPKQDVAQA